MKNLLLSLLFFISPAWATTYYIVDCQSGADAACAANIGSNGNNGTTPSTPFLNLSGLPSGIGGLAAGDSVLWAKGSSQNFASSTTVNNSNATAASPITFGSFVPSWGAGTAKPLMTLTSSSPPTQIFNLTGSGQAGFIFDGLDFRATGGNATSAFGAVYLSTNVNDVTFKNNTCDGIGTCFQSAAGTLGATHSKRLKLLSNNFFRSNSMAVLIAGDEILIEGNTFLDNALSNALGDHHIYLSCTVNASGESNARGCRDATVRRNTFTDTAHSCSSVMVVQHNLFTGIVVEGNVFKQTSATAAGTCYGIQFAQGNFDTDIEGCRSCIARGNVIAEVGYIGIDMSQCITCLAENNVIVHTLAGNFVGVRFGGTASSASDFAMSANIARNNSVYLANPDADSYGVYFGPNASGTGHQVVGNLVYIGNNASISYCYFTELTTAAFVTWDKNLCYTAGGSSRWGSLNGTSYTTLAAFISGTGFDTNSVSADPVLRNTPSSANSYDMQIQTTSPAKNVCSTVCARLAFQAYPAVGTRDIGAYEFGSNP